MVSPIITGIATIGSLITVGFGVWHLFVPKLWNWYQYMDAQATELVLAVRAINVFFSASLIIFGVTTLIFLYRQPVDVFYLRVHLGMMALLWGIPLPMAVMPVIYFGAAAALVRSRPLTAATVVFPIGHLAVSTHERRRIASLAR